MIPPKVTIGIPTRNRAAYVVRAVRSALAQTCGDIEVVVSDNASTDDTLERLAEIADPRLVTLRHAANIGMVANFNACLDRASGGLFLMLSDDDALEPTAIQELSSSFECPPAPAKAASVGLAWCPCTIVDAAGNAMWSTEGGPVVESPLAMITGLFNGLRGPRLCSVMIRTADARAVGGYNQERHGAICDTGNWTRAALRYDYAVCLDRPLARYTIHNASETSQSAVADWQRFGENIYEDLLEVLRARGVAPSRQLYLANRNHIANLIVTVLLQTVGRPGWVGNACRETLRARHYMLTPFVARRLLRDGWKLGRLGRR